MKKKVNKFYRVKGKRKQIANKRNGKYVYAYMYCI